MPRKCTICAHKKRDTIDRELALCGDPYRTIAGRFKVSKTALMRHHGSHLPARLVKAKEAREIASAGRLLAEVQGLKDRAISILEKAEKERDYRTALHGIREARGCLELLGRLAGELQDGATVNVLVLPEWVEIKSLILDSLRPYPEARAAVTSKLKELPSAGR